MTVVIAPNIVKEKAFINANGDIIDKTTKQIIEKNVGEDITQELPQELPQVVQPIEKALSPLSIQEQIDQAKENLAKLEELKKLKIAEMRAQLELLESE